jgi:hypothetical protein
MQHSAIHDPRTISTPSQRLAWAARSNLRAKIAAKAGALQPPRILTFEIPNTPFGVPKIPPTRPVVKRDPPPVYRLWCDDLIAEATRQCRPARKMTVQDIQEACAAHYGRTRADVLSEVRRANFVRPRQVAMYLTRKLTDRSWHEMGRQFGGRDHSTGIHAFQKIERLVSIDPQVAADVAAIMAAISVRIA